MEGFAKICLHCFQSNLDLSCIHTAQSPRFIYEPPSFHGFSNSTGGSLTCSAHGLPTPRLTWVDGKEQPVRTVPGLRHVLENGTLIFPPFPPQDYDSSIHEQEYRCVISNSAGTVVSRQARVRAGMHMKKKIKSFTA